MYIYIITTCLCDEPDDIPSGYYSSNAIAYKNLQAMFECDTNEEYGVPECFCPDSALEPISDEFEYDRVKYANGRYRIEKIELDNDYVC